MDHQRPITVLQFCEHFGGRKASLHGVSRTFQWWLPLFDRNRFRVLLCSRKGFDEATEQMVKSGLHPLTLGYGKTDPRNLIKLVRLLRKERVDIIHAHGFGACMWGRIAGHLLGIPVIVHGRCNYGTVPWYQRPIEALLGPFTKYALAVSESTRQFTIRKRHIPADRVEVLYNGILLDGIQLAAPEWTARERRALGAGESTIVVGVLGRLEAHKGLTDAMEAVAGVREIKADVQLWVVGDGAFADELRQYAEARGYGDFVRFTGFRRDALEIIQCFDIQLFPSHQEGTPNTLFEAMAVGRPIAASTADGQGEILEDGQTALLFEPGDVPTVTNLLLRLAEDEPLRKKLSENALAKVHDFDGHRTVRRMENLYLQVLGMGENPDPGCGRPRTEPAT